MPRLDVYLIPGARGTRYVLDVQAKLLEYLASRVVVPMVKADTIRPVAGLNPVFDIEGEPYVMLTQAMASIPVRELRRSVTSLDSRHDDITRALDILLLGF